MSTSRPEVKAFYDPRTFSVQYVASCPNVDFRGELTRDFH